MFLEINDLKKSFGNSDNKTEVLKGISFNVEKEEFCVLLGPSGSGKSTLLNIIGGIDSADNGYISIWISFYVLPSIYPKMLIMRMGVYAVIALLQFMKIKKVPMDEALKNVE